MPTGDIKISSLSVGKINLLDSSQAQFFTFEIYEDILNPYGPSCEIHVADPNDVLGKARINGSYDQDINIQFSQESGFGGSANFKFKMLANKNLKDGALMKTGGGRYKEYKIRGVAKELLAAQGNYVQKSYEEQTSKIVEEILKNYFKTDKQVDIQETTKGKRRVVFGNEHPLKALQRLNTEHVGSSSKSSAFVVFQQGGEKYIFTTFEKLFEQGSVVTLKQRPTLDFSRSNIQDKQNAILWINVDDSFFTANRSMSKPQEIGYDSTTGKAYAADTRPPNSYKTADGSTTQGVYSQPPSFANNVPVVTRKDASNDAEKTGVAEARKNRMEYVSHLAQNYATLEVVGNPNIKLGSIVELDVPNKSVSDMGSGERQFNGKALVVSIRHKIGAMGTSPRYTMLLGVIKASYKDGGGGNG